MSVPDPGDEGCWVLRREIPLQGPGATGEERALLRQLPGTPLEGLLVFDIESTGLSIQGGDLAVVIGVLRWESAAEVLVLEQAVLASRAGEPALLRWWNAQVRAARAVLSYNGQRFDARLLAARLRACALPDALARVPHWDLLRHFRQHPPPNVSRLKLTVLEREVLNFHRMGDPPGEEVARLLRGWLAGEVQPLPTSVLLHNRLDLISLLVLFEQHARPQLDAPASEQGSRSIAKLQARPLPDVATPEPVVPPLRWRREEDAAPLRCWSTEVRATHADAVRAALHDGRVDRATALLQRWIEAEPTFGRPHAWLADVLEANAGDLRGAAHHAQRALDLHPWDELLARRVRRLEAKLAEHTARGQG